MSTNARITIKELDGTRKSIYLHNDGYIENAGVTLQLAYNTADKVRKLISLGNLSVLGYYTEPTTDKHSFETPETSVCVAYHRDRGEDLEFWDSEQEFNYVFDTYDNCWYVEDSHIVEETTASKELGLNYVSLNRKYLLLDGIIDCGDYLEENWVTDNFAEKGNVVNTCITKAKVGRNEDFYTTYND